MRFLLLSLIACLLLCLEADGGGKTIYSGPRLVIMESLHDFGSLREGVTVSHAFGILNKGDQVLNIDKVKPD